MLLIETLYTGDAAPAARLELNFDARTKSRLRTQLVGGEEVGMFLPRGTILRGGDRLQAQDGRVVEVVSAPEDLLEARCADAFALAGWPITWATAMWRCRWGRAGCASRRTTC